MGATLAELTIIGVVYARAGELGWQRVGSVLAFGHDVPARFQVAGARTRWRGARREQLATLLAHLAFLRRFVLSPVT